MDILTIVSKVLVIALPAMAVRWIFLYLQKEGNKRIQANEDGRFMLRTTKAYMAFGYMSIMTMIVLLGYVFIQDSKIFDDKTSFFIVLLFGCVPGLIGLSLILYYKNYWVIFDDELIIASGWKGSTQQIKWEEITSITFSMFNRSLTISDGVKTIEISIQLIGFQSFFDKMEQKTKWKKKDLKINKLYA